MSISSQTLPSFFGIALFGVGRAGSIHFKNLIHNPRCRLRYIVELNTAAAEALVNKYHISDVKVIHNDDVQNVYNDKLVDAVIVCSTTFTHDEIVISALNHGKAVFCEKPLSGTVEGVNKCYETAKEAGLPLLCSFNRRFDPSVCLVKQRVDRGDIGPVHVIKTCSRDHPLPAMNFLKVSGGFFHDCAVHDLDMVCWLLGEFPVSVFVQAHVHDPGIASLNDVDTAAILLKFPSGAIGILDLGRHASYGYDQRLEVNGIKGMLQSENQVSHGFVNSTEKGVTNSVYKDSFPQRYADSYVNAIEHFFDVLQGNGDVLVKQKETVNASQLCEACEESYRTGLPVVVTY